ncbi:hypothetical protein PMAYCL1PPCAC_01266, partial [Pristionchus mayeri]
VVEPELIESMIKQVSVFETPVLKLTLEQKEQLFKELLRKIDEKPYLFCSFCDRFIFTARQAFMHMSFPEHIEKTMNASENFVIVNCLMRMMVGEWRVDQILEEAEQKEKTQREKWSSMSLEDPQLRPIGDPSQQLFGLERIEEVKQLIESFNRRTHAVPNAVMAEVWMKVMEEHSGRLMQLLNKEIGRAKTRCFDCKLIFGNAAEYYTHVLTFFHICNARPFDLTTLVVNIQKRHIARLQPWPQLPSLMASAAAVQKEAQSDAELSSQPPSQESEAITTEKEEQPESAAEDGELAPAHF